MYDNIIKLIYYFLNQKIKKIFKIEKHRKRKRNSIEKLAKFFVILLKNKKSRIINLDEIIKKFKVQKTRIYAIIDVLQGCELLKREGNKIILQKPEFFQNYNLFTVTKENPINKTETKTILNNNNNNNSVSICQNKINNTETKETNLDPFREKEFPDSISSDKKLNSSLSREIKEEDQLIEIKDNKVNNLKSSDQIKEYEFFTYDEIRKFSNSYEIDLNINGKSSEAKNPIILSCKDKLNISSFNQTDLLTSIYSNLKEKNEDLLRSDSKYKVCYYIEPENINQITISFQSMNNRIIKFGSNEVSKFFQNNNKF